VGVKQRGYASFELLGFGPECSGDSIILLYGDYYQKILPSVEVLRMLPG
jgi:hypothetical protein